MTEKFRYPSELRKCNCVVENDDDDGNGEVQPLQIFI